MFPPPRIREPSLPAPVDATTGATGVAPRAIWKGQLCVGALSCGVALYAAATTSERTSFHIVNKKTGNRVRRDYVDEQTGDPVPREHQVKGYEVSRGQYVLLEPDEIASAVPEATKSLQIDAFLPCGQVDAVYFDKPYFLKPADDADAEAFAVMREGMRKSDVAAVARAVLFRRVRTVLIRARGCGFLAHTLHFDYEILPAAEAFKPLPDTRIKGEMLDLARHIIGTKRGAFDPAAFDDRYDAALADLVRTKAEGGTIAPPKRKGGGDVIDLMEALRQSAGKPAKAGGRGPKGTGARPAQSSPAKSAPAKSAPAKAEPEKTPARKAPARKSG
jgi:DNA end-binding protein Ku